MNAPMKIEMNMRARPSTLVLQEYSVRYWGMTVPPGVNMDQVLKPEFWAHVAVRQLRPFDDVRVSCEDGSWSALLFCREADKGGALMGVIWHRDFTEDDAEFTPDQSEEFEIKFRGPTHKHCVIRLSDKKQLISGLSKTEAVSYVETRMRQGFSPKAV